MASISERVRLDRREETAILFIEDETTDQRDFAQNIARASGGSVILTGDVDAVSEVLLRSCRDYLIDLSHDGQLDKGCRIVRRFAPSLGADGRFLFYTQYFDEANRMFRSAEATAWSDIKDLPQMFGCVNKSLPSEQSTHQILRAFDRRRRVEAVLVLEDGDHGEDQIFCEIPAWQDGTRFEVFSDEVPDQVLGTLTRQRGQGTVVSGEANVFAAGAGSVELSIGAVLGTYPSGLERPYFFEGQVQGDGSD